VEAVLTRPAEIDGEGEEEEGDGDVDEYGRGRVPRFLTEMMPNASHDGYVEPHHDHRRGI